VARCSLNKNSFVFKNQDFLSAKEKEKRVEEIPLSGSSLNQALQIFQLLDDNVCHVISIIKFLVVAGNRNTNEIGILYVHLLDISSEIVIRAIGQEPNFRMRNRFKPLRLKLFFLDNVVALVVLSTSECKGLHKIFLQLLKCCVVYHLAI
jgi:hypothetical protein